MVFSYFSGIVDENDHLPEAPYPGRLSHLLPWRTEEFLPLPPGDAGVLDNGWKYQAWAERLTLLSEKNDSSVEVMAHYSDSPLEGLPAVVRHNVGHSGGELIYVSAQLDGGSQRELATEISRLWNIAPELPVHLRGKVEVVQRVDHYGTLYTFLINKTDLPVGVEPFLPGFSRHGLCRDPELPPYGVELFIKHSKVHATT